MLGVGPEAFWLRSLSAWISEKLYETVVVTCSDKCLVLRSVNPIDMSSISALREETIDTPPKLAMLTGPNS